jgi:cytochrome c
MLPHPQHTLDEISIMLRWVFDLDAKKATPGLSRGLTGELIAPQDDKVEFCVLEATYTDAGRATAGPLSGKATVTLRSRRIEADRHDGLSGPTKLHSGGCTNSYCLGAIDHGHHVRFARIDFSKVGAIKVRASSGNVGGKIEFRVGSATGDLLGSVEVPNTGGWEKWIESQAKLATTAPTGQADLFAVFVNPGQGGLLNLDWIEFQPR